MPMNLSPIRTKVPDPRHRPEAIAERILPADMRRGRGAATNATGRFELEKREDFDDGWTRDEVPEPLKTEVTWEKPKATIRRTERRVLDLIGRSTPIAAASTAASIATPVLRTPIRDS